MKHPEESLTAEEQFGRMVRQAREDLAWTQEDLRARLADRGISLEKTAMIRLEGGKRPIRFNEVVALTGILGLDLGRFDRFEKSEPDPARTARALEQLTVARANAAAAEEELRASETHTEAARVRYRAARAELQMIEYFLKDLDQAQRDG